MEKKKNILIFFGISLFFLTAGIATYYISSIERKPAEAQVVYEDETYCEECGNGIKDPTYTDENGNVMTETCDYGSQEKLGSNPSQDPHGRGLYNGDQCTPETPACDLDSECEWCDATCQVHTEKAEGPECCGNSDIDPGEECDNGLENGLVCTPETPACDGSSSCTWCDNDCKLHEETLEGPPCPPAQECGNGIIEGNEECDLGAEKNGKLCSLPSSNNCNESVSCKYCSNDCKWKKRTGACECPVINGVQSQCWEKGYCGIKWNETGNYCNADSNGNCVARRPSDCKTNQACCKGCPTNPYGSQYNYPAKGNACRYYCNSGNNSAPAYCDSPLIFDLDLDGDVDAENYIFLPMDLDDNGVLDKTSYLPSGSGNDGLLIFDADGNEISGENQFEVFGSHLSEGYDNGFEKLKSLASQKLGESAVEDNNLSYDEIQKLENLVHLQVLLADGSKKYLTKDYNIENLSLAYEVPSSLSEIKINQFGFRHALKGEGASFKRDGEIITAPVDDVGTSFELLQFFCPKDKISSENI